MNHSMKIVRSKVMELKELRKERDILDKKIGNLEDWIKKEMASREKYELSGEDWSITWNMVCSARFNQSRFKEDNPFLFEKYKEITESRRFIIK